MAKLVLRYGEQNDISYGNFGLCPQNIGTIVDSTVSTIGLGDPTSSLEEKDNLHLALLLLLHLYSVCDNLKFVNQNC